MRIFEREINGRRYRIGATSERVPGKKHPVSRQICLGPVEDDEPFIPSRCEDRGSRRVGDVGALIEVAEELDVLGAFGAAAPGQGMCPSLGEMILAVALQRVCSPRAKRHLPEFLDSCLPRFSARKARLFSGQNFHRITREVADETYDKVQLTIAARACTLYGLKTDVLAYDTTNFDTFIATTTTKVDLAERGHAKSKRMDLKVVGLAMMTSRTHSVPLFHRTYAGNDNDKTVLGQTLGCLAKLHDALGKADRTLVRDGGFAGEQLELDLMASGYHSVTVLPLTCTDARDALRKALGKLQPLPGRLRDIGAWRMRTKIGEVDRTLLVIESPELLEGQLRGMRKATAKALSALEQLATRLKEQREGTLKGRHYTVESVRRRVKKLTKREHVSEVLHIEVRQDLKAPALIFSHDPAAEEQLIRERLGKRVLTTDQHEWSSAAIVRAFRSQWKVERAFRRMKRGRVSPWGPSYQWTDDSLRAHTFAAVLGLQLASLAALKLANAGIKRSTKGCLELLASIRLTRLTSRQHPMGGPREAFVPRHLARVYRAQTEESEIGRVFQG